MAIAISGANDATDKVLRWRTLAAIVTIWFTTYFVRLAWVNVSANASQTLGASAATLSSFITFFFVGYVFANATGGFVIDRLGRSGSSPSRCSCWPPRPSASAALPPRPKGGASSW